MSCSETIKYIKKLKVSPHVKNDTMFTLLYVIPLIEEKYARPYDVH